MEKCRDDSYIVQLYWERSEAAIGESSARYGTYCRAVAFGILRDRLEAEEAENDTYLRAWNAMPPARPLSLKAFLGRICRNLSLDRLRFLSAEKRGGRESAAVLDELAEVVSGGSDPAQELEDQRLTEALNDFLAGLEAEKRKVFMRRYWYMDGISEIARLYGLTESNVKVILYRLRQQLKDVLSKEGFEI